MSYTLRGRLETRLAAVLVTLVGAAVLAAVVHEWWPLVLGGLMAAVGVAMDIVAYDRLFEYQPGWLALPLGALELALVVGAAHALSIRAPLPPAVALFAAGWLVAQVLGHAVLPLVHLTYDQDGGELGRGGPAFAAATLALLAAATGAAYAQRPPTVYLSRGVHQGPLVLDSRQTLVGRPGAVVRGGIRVRASDVAIRNVTVVGGENGIDVEEVRNVVLDGVSVSGFQLDGIHVRHATVAIHECTVDSGANQWAQGIDISFAADLEMSEVSGCTVIGGREGIVTHSVETMLMGNHVRQTQFRGISVTEMSMGMVEHNDVHGARGVALYCGDRSMCEFAHNVVSGTRPDHTSSDPTYSGYALVSWFESDAQVKDNVFVGNTQRARAFARSKIRPMG